MTLVTNSHANWPSLVAELSGPMWHRGYRQLAQLLLVRHQLHSSMVILIHALTNCASLCSTLSVSLGQELFMSERFSPLKSTILAARRKTLVILILQHSFLLDALESTLLSLCLWGWTWNLSTGTDWADRFTLWRYWDSDEKWHPSGLELECSVLVSILQKGHHCSLFELVTIQRCGFRHR